MHRRLIGTVIVLLLAFPLHAEDRITAAQIQQVMDTTDAAAMKRDTAGAYDGLLSASSNLANTATAVTWNVQQIPLAVNLGKGCSEEFGIYCFGVRNYASTITEGEAARVARFLAMTGKLPFWWL